MKSSTVRVTEEVNNVELASNKGVLIVSNVDEAFKKLGQSFNLIKYNLANGVNILKATSILIGPSCFIIRFNYF